MWLVEWVKVMVAMQFARYRRLRGLPDEALETIEKVVITALAVTAAGVIVGIIVTKATDKANTITP